MREIEMLIERFDLLLDAPDSVSKLRHLILDVAIRGKLVDQDPNDEPASVLLERIAEEKARLVKEGKIKKPKKLPAIDPDEVPFELPAEWKFFRFGFAFDIQGGTQPPKSTFMDSPGQGYIRLLQIRDFGTKPVPTYVPEDRVRRFCTEDDILIGRYGASVGKIFTGMRGAYNVALAKLVYPNGAFAKEYLINMLRTGLFQNPVTGISRSAQAGFNKGDLFPLILPLPPLPEQHRIVAKVDQLMALCDELEQQQAEREKVRVKANSAAVQTLLACNSPTIFTRNWKRIRDNFDLLYSDPANVQELRQGILQLAVQGKLVPQDVNDEPASVLLERITEEKARLVKEGKIKKDKPFSNLISDVPPFEIPVTWQWTTLQSIFEISRGGSPRPSGDPLYFGGNIPWITVYEITKDDEKYLTRTKDGLTEEGKKKSRLISPDDLLITNSGATLGVPKISLISGCINDGVAVLRNFHSFEINNYSYLYLYQQTSSFRNINQGQGQPNLNTSILASWHFPLPPLPEQRRIVAKVDQLMAQCDELETKLATSQGVSSRLLEAVVAGVVDS
ncbi:MAG: restriction endonuclease subunit S [Bacteroidota bacterium]